LASNNTLLPMPASSVIVPANATSTAFAATAGRVHATKQRATITASFGGGSASVSIVIRRGNTWLQPLVDKPLSNRWRCSESEEARLRR
jgi:hypothetical protein